MKWLFILTLLFSYDPLHAQIEEIPDEQPAARSKNSELSIVRKFKFTSEINDTITIKIINPRGELLQVAVQEYPVTAWQSFYFEQEGTTHLPGNYQIIVEGKEGRRFTRRIIMDREENSRKKS